MSKLTPPSPPSSDNNGFECKRLRAFTSSSASPSVGPQSIFRMRQRHIWMDDWIVDMADKPARNFACCFYFIFFPPSYCFLYTIKRFWKTTTRTTHTQTHMDARSRASSTQNTSADTHKYFVGRIYLYFVSKNISYLDFTFSWQFIVCTPDAPSSPIIIFCYILSLDLYVFAASVFFLVCSYSHSVFHVHVSDDVYCFMCASALCANTSFAEARVNRVLRVDPCIHLLSNFGLLFLHIFLWGACWCFGFCHSDFIIRKACSARFHAHFSFTL